MPTATAPATAPEKKLLGSMSRRALARKANLHPSYVSRVLKGERRISLTAAKQWSRARGITLDELFRQLTKQIKSAAAVMALLAAWMAIPMAGVGVASADQVCAIPLSSCSGGGGAVAGGDVAVQANFCGPDNATNVEIGSCTTDANAGTGGTSTAIGNAATNSGNGTANVLIGSAATITNGSSSVAIGAGAATTGNQSVSIGQGASAGTNLGVAVGALANNASFGSSIALGAGATNTATTQFVVGASGVPIYDWYSGKGVTSTSAVTWTLHGTGGSGADNAGGGVTIAPGIGTGTAVGGQVVLQRTQRTTTGTTAQALLPAYISCPSKILSNTSTTVQDIATITTTASSAGSVFLYWTVTASDGTAVNADAGMNIAAWNNNSGTVAGAITAIDSPAGSDSSGTLTNTVTVSSATNVFTIRLTPSWTVIVPTLVTGYVTFLVNGVNSVVCL